MDFKFPVIITMAILLAATMAVVIPTDVDATDAQEYMLEGEFIPYESLPQALLDQTADSEHTISLKYTYSKVIEASESAYFYINLNYGYDSSLWGSDHPEVSVTAYAMAIDANGNIQIVDGCNAIFVKQMDLATTDSAEDGFEIPASLTQSAIKEDNLGGAMYVALVADAIPDGFHADVCVSLEFMDETPAYTVSNTLCAYTHMDVQMDINGKSVDGAMMTVIDNDLPSIFILDRIVMNVAAGSDIETITIAELSDSHLSDIQNSAIADLIGDGGKLIFDINFDLADGCTYIPGSVSIDFTSPFQVQEGRTLAIACVDDAGNVDLDAAVIDDGTITFNHNSIYVLYTTEELKVDEGLANGLAGIIIAISVIAVAITLFAIRTR